MAKKKKVKSSGRALVATKQMSVKGDKVYVRVYRRKNNSYVANIVHYLKKK